MILRWEESLDIGSDTLIGVDDKDYQTCFLRTARMSKSLGKP